MIKFVIIIYFYNLHLFFYRVEVFLEFNLYHLLSKKNCQISLFFRSQISQKDIFIICNNKMIIRTGSVAWPKGRNFFLH